MRALAMQQGLGPFEASAMRFARYWLFIGCGWFMIFVSYKEGCKNNELYLKSYIYIQIMSLPGLFSMISRYPMQMTQSAISSLLDDPDVTLDKLLDEDTSFISDFKNQNPRLMQFMKYDKYKTLIEYVTKVGPEGDQKRSYKYPFVACDVLTTENNSPAEFILPEKDLYVEEDELEEVEVEEEVEEPQPPTETPPPKDEPEADKTETTETTTAETIEVEKPVPSTKPEEAAQPEKEAATEEVKEEKDDKEPKEDEETKDDKEEVKPAEKIEAEAEPAKKITKRLVKKEVVKKVKKQVPPLINDLFSYLDQQLNYTLAGYFSRILIALFAKKSTSLTNYFFSSPKNFKILNHADSRSIAQVIVKFLTVDSLSFLPQRQSLLLQILSRLSKRSNVNLMCNLSFILCDVIEKYSSTVKSVLGSKEMLQYVYSNKFCKLLIDNILSDDEEVSIYNTPTLLTSLLSIRSLIDSKEQSKNTELVDKYQDLMTFLKNSLAESSELSELFKGFFLKAVDKLNLTKKQSPALGMGRIKLIESLFLLIKFDFYNIQTIVPQSKFFERLLQLTKEYQLNNVLHNEVIRMLAFALELEEPNSLIRNLFEQGNIIEFLHEQVVEDDAIQAKIASKEKGAFRRGYLGHIVKIGQLIGKLATTNTQINGYLSDERWEKIKALVEKQTFEAEKNLAGYTTRKIDANNVMFHKEDILALHQAFLSQPPITTYPEPEPNPADDLQETINLIQARLHIHDTAPTTPVVEQTKKKEQQQGMAVFASPTYWKETKTLRYDINDLLGELE